LWETSRRYSVSVLNYMVTSNHVHLLLWSESPCHVAAAMQYLSGAVAQDYNRRLGREGAFWRGRYRPTLVEDGHHLTRCFFYVELNMVRAGVVRHPSEWYGGAFSEHSGARQRYRIIDRHRLLNCLECADGAAFAHWYGRTLNEECESRYHVRESLWSDAAAVGSRHWIEGIAGRLAAGMGTGSIMPKPAELAEALQYNYLLFLVPFVFYAFGWAFHIILDLKHKYKFVFLGGLIGVTFFVDFLLALLIHNNSEYAKELMGLATKSWAANPAFWMILFLGFIVYILWSILLDSLFREYAKRAILRNLKKIVKHLRDDVKELQKKLMPE